MTLFLLLRHRPSWTDHGYQRRRTTQQNGGERRSSTSGWGQEWEVVETYAHRPWSYTERAVASVLVLLVAAAVAWSRVYLGYHTVKQVLVGTLAGAVSAGAWYAVTAVLRNMGLLAWALEAPPARGLRLRDLVVSEDLAQAGWEKWEDRKAGGGAAGDVQAAAKKRK